MPKKIGIHITDSARNVLDQFKKEYGWTQGQSVSKALLHLAAALESGTTNPASESFLENRLEALESRMAQIEAIVGAHQEKEHSPASSPLDSSEPQAHMQIVEDPATDPEQTTQADEEPSSDSQPSDCSSSDDSELIDVEGKMIERKIHNVALMWVDSENFLGPYYSDLQMLEQLRMRSIEGIDIRFIDNFRKKYAWLLDHVRK